MSLRTAILPHTLIDTACSLLLLIAPPIIFYFELCVVLPTVYPIHTHFGQFCLHATLGCFILLNIISNQLALVLTDTSIKRKHLTPPTNGSHLKMWRLCVICETLCPPRSWHCDTCNTCILKRDHHCVFTACCVGHLNQRYFVMMVFYLCVGTTYANVFNNYFIWIVNAERFCHYSTALKLIFPFAMVAYAPDWDSMYLALYLLSMITMLFSGFLLAFHLQNLNTGAVVNERGAEPLYNLGTMENFRMTFGRKWYWIWLHGFVKSELPHNGIHWETVLDQNVKRR